MRLTEARGLLERLAGRRIVVIGDLILDEYLVGRPERLSREAPVPVLAFSRRFCRLGGAANPAWNISALGACAVQVGVTGNDESSRELTAALASVGIDAAGVVCDEDRPTSVKTRVVAEGMTVGQQVARIDRLSREPLSSEVESEVIRALVSGCVGADAVLVSHYRCGVITEAVCDAARDIAKSSDLLLAADAQGDLDLFGGFDLIRVGRGDVTRGLGRSLVTEADFESAATDIRRELGARAVILGRGPAGMSVADDLGYAVVPPANVSEVYDVTGAGDTVIAVLTLAIAAGAPVRQGVELANWSAGIVVRRLGVAAPSSAEILSEVGRTQHVE